MWAGMRREPRQPQMKQRETPREVADHSLGVCSEARDLHNCGICDTLSVAHVLVLEARADTRSNLWWSLQQPC